MHTVIIIILFFIFYILMIKRIVKLNTYNSLIMMTVVVSLTVYTFNHHKVDKQFSIIHNLEQVQTIRYEERTVNHPITSKVTRKVNFNNKINEPKVVVKDLQFIYSIVHNKVIINDIQTLEEIKELPFESKPMYLAIYNDKLVVLCEIDNNMTEVYVYHLLSFELDQHFKINAKYVTSQIINQHLYLVTSQIIEDPKQKPTYTMNNKRYTVQDIYHIKDTFTNNFINLVKINLNKDDDVKVLSYLGLGYTVYFGDRNIYIAEEKLTKEDEKNRSILLKISNNQLKPVSTHEIKGYILDKYSLNEDQGYLRVLSSENYNEEFTSHLYIFNDEMRLLSKLENFSKGNQVQAATFIHNKAIVETFNIIDPMYIIDLSNPKKPFIISEEIFDGYNTLLFPYEKNHILAFGYVLGEDKLPNGLKISLYDVKNRIRLISQENIMYKDYNSAFSEVLYDSQSLLIDKDLNVIGFPVTYYLGSNPNKYKQQFFLYSINIESGLNRLGSISHDENGKNNMKNHDIKSGFIFNNRLYTISDRMIKVNHIHDLKLIDHKNYR